MPNTLQRVVIIAVVCSGISGCKSGARWDWWRLGRAGAPDSSPIARSAGPSLPSELAQQGDSQLAGNMQMPNVDSGSEAPAYEQDTANLWAGDSGLAGGNSSTPSAYMSRVSTPTDGAQAAGSGTNAAGDPFARSRVGATADASGVSVQRGPYDPNSYAATPPPQVSTPTSAEGNRYGYSATQHGGANIAVSAPQDGRPAPWSGSSSLPSERVAAAGYQQPSSAGASPASKYPSTYPSTSPSQVAVSQRDYSGSTGNPAVSGGIDGPARYGAAAPGGSDATAGAGTLAPSYGGSLYADTASSTRQPYRPGGTSDYTGPGDSSQVSIAGRQSGETGASADAATPSVEPPTPIGRYGVPAGGYGSGETGRRY